ncbi:MAG: alpha/beta hydrolase [Capsulimonas sp.]|uniref:alpha/beta hydrolase n=1 Tax=Capsulimonas sp. TaxID=2494211 RepID=UPI00326372DC
MKQTVLSAIGFFCLLTASAPHLSAQPQVGESLTQPTMKETTEYRDLSYVSNGHPRQKLDLYLPLHAKHPPLIVMIHGGAFLFGDKGDENVGKFIHAGYGVASINYRLSSDAILPAQIEDCKAAVRWLRANADHYGYDPQRFGAYGESAGGNMAAMLGVTGDIKTYDVGENRSVSSRVQAVVDYFGPTDYLQMDAHGLPGGWNNDAPDSPASRLIGGPIQENKDKTKKANPITYISPKASPFFIAHGDADNIVPHHQSELLLAALQKAGGSATLYTVRGAGHGFQDAEADKLAIAFFGKYLHPDSSL